MFQFMDLEAFRRAPLRRDPFDFVVVRGFLRDAARESLTADFPEIRHRGSFPVGVLTYGPTFGALLEEVQSEAFRRAVEEKFGLDLTGRPILITVRGRSGPGDGQVHTDAPWKLVTVLIYMNPGWEAEGGRLRLLRSPRLDDVAEEIPPEWGVLVAFRRSDRSYHGHRPYTGERRVLQVNWVVDERRRQWELRRHGLAAWLKRLGGGKSSSSV